MNTLEMLKELETTRGRGGMKLYVTFVNTLPWEELHIIPRRRVVEVEMTPEQVQKLTPRRVGMIRGVERYEEIEICVLQIVEGGRADE